MSFYPLSFLLPDVNSTISFLLFLFRRLYMFTIVGTTKEIIISLESNAFVGYL